MKRLAAGVAAAVALTACGSTVGPQNGAAVTANGDGLTGVDSGSGLNPPGPTGPTPALVGRDPQPVAGSTSAGATTGAVPEGGGAGSAAPARPLRATYPGVTASSISIGLSTAQSSDSTGGQVGQSFGIGGFSQASDKPLQEAMIAYVNKAGGVAGRKLVPVYHSYSGTDPRSYAVQSQETCAAFTEDNKVFAHLSVVSDPTFYSCMDSRGTVGVERSEIGSQQLSVKYPGVFSVSDLNYTTAGALTVQALVKRGFLTKQNRIGLIQADTADFELARSGGMDQAMRAAGLAFTTTYKVTPVNTAGDAALVVRDANSAVLRFKSDRIDRVLFLTPYGGLFDAVFMKNASSQKYRPKYGLSSHDAPVALGGGNTPAGQLEGAQGVGWGPLDDLKDVPAAQVPASQSLCLKVFRDAKIAKPADRGQLNQYLGYCASFLLFADIARKAGPNLTRASFIAAGESLGRGFNNPFTISGLSNIGHGSHQGVAAHQAIAYSAGCDCFRPSGPVVRFR